MVSEVQKEEIRKEAMVILDRFSKELEKVDLGGLGVKSSKGKELKREMGGFRKEGHGAESGDGLVSGKFSGSETSKKQKVSDFRKQMFENAPKKDGDCLMAEKKKW